MADIAASLAQSNVDVIEACLNTPPDEHTMECEEEWMGWVEGLGERPGMYLGMVAFGPPMPFLAAIDSWRYWSDPAIRAEVDRLIAGVESSPHSGSISPREEVSE